MTLDEAIEHALDKSKNPDSCDECREDHKQLAKWLQALKRAEELLNESYGWFGALTGDGKPLGLIGKLMGDIEEWKKSL